MIIAPRWYLLAGLALPPPGAELPSFATPGISPDGAEIAFVNGGDIWTVPALSDAEDVTEGYRTLGLGKVVGEPTAGWIIYTSSSRAPA